MVPLIVAPTSPQEHRQGQRPGDALQQEVQAAVYFGSGFFPFYVTNLTAILSIMPNNLMPYLLAKSLNDH
jgi:hypothetical protein